MCCNIVYSWYFILGPKRLCYLGPDWHGAGSTGIGAASTCFHLFCQVFFPCTWILDHCYQYIKDVKRENVFVTGLNTCITYKLNQEVAFLEDFPVHQSWRSCGCVVCVQQLHVRSGINHGYIWSTHLHLECELWSV